MLLIADESVDAPVIQAVRDAEYDVRAIAEASPSARDEDVLLEAVSAEAVLITLDRDFGELIFKERLPAPRAIIYVRSKGMSISSMTAEILSALRDRRLDGAHITIDRNQRRMRRLPSSGEKQ